jgi:hypothetical protein
MGYRSDVTMIMYPSADHRDKFAALKLYVDENLPDEFEVIGEGDRRYLHCYIDGVKWYDSYEEVERLHQSCSASGTRCLPTLMTQARRRVGKLTLSFTTSSCG